MAERKITKDYVEFYKKIEFIQPLAKGAYLKEIYTQCLPQKPGMWLISYESNSAHHVCPYDGRFMTCEKCMADYSPVDEEDEVEYCLQFEQRVTSKELAKRVNTCKKAGLKAFFYDGTEK